MVRVASGGAGCSAAFIPWSNKQPDGLPEYNSVKKTIAATITVLAFITVAGCNDEPADSAAGNAKAALNIPDAKVIFAANCASCHRLNEDATGPALSGAPARWNNDTARLKNFIRNWGTVTASGKDPRANELAAKWGTMMTSFPALTDAELNALLDYMK